MNDEVWLVTYSFSENDVFLIIDPVSDFVPLPFNLPFGVPINISSRDFFGKDGAVSIEPNPEAISSDEKSIEGDDLWDISNDRSGRATLRVGDLSRAHVLLSMIHAFQRRGLLVGDISLNVNQRPFGQGVSESVTGLASIGSLLYSCRNGTIKGVPNKQWGSVQTGNEFLIQFNVVDGGPTLFGAVSQFLG